MAISVKCAWCEAGVTVPDSAAGKTVKCPSCGKVLAVPTADPSAPETLFVTEMGDDAPPRPNVVDQPTYPLQPPPTESPTVPISTQGPIVDIHATLQTMGSLPMTVAPIAVPSLPGYEIKGELGRGGMGVVYKARHIKSNRIVALKMIIAGRHADLEHQIRFQIEAEAVAHLQHPNIVHLHDVGEHDGMPFFSLEFCDGDSLDRKLKTWTPTPDEAASLVETLARAMHYAHLRGVVHRDLKPANVLMASRGRESPASSPDGDSRPRLAELVPKITDFGLAKKLDSGNDLSRVGAVMGTPSYMAPEQARGEIHDTGPAADVYALGALFYELLTGQPPFKGATSFETIQQVLNEEPATPSSLRKNIPRDLETICLKCLRKQPEKRYESAEDLANDLRRFLNGEPVRARPLGKGERFWRWCRRHPVPASLLLTIVVGSLFGMWFFSRLSHEVVRTSALESASQQAEMFERLNDFYSEKVVAPSGIKATHDYGKEPGTIPTPATLTIDLGEYISQHSQRGLQVRVYSDYPFLNRQANNEGGPRDDFEARAMEHLRRHPDEPYSEFEEYQDRPVLRYAKARVMKASCVACHNKHPLSPKKDWKTGDVRGVLEIIRPLDVDQKNALSGMRGAVMLIGGICATMLAFSLLVLFLSRRSRRGR
jgi:serine/threonine protein kinase